MFNGPDSSTMGHATDGELIALIDDEPIERRAELQRHFLDCPRCGRRLGALRGASDRVSSALGTIEMPTLDAARIRRRLESTPWRRRSSGWIAPVGGAAAAILVIAGAAAATSPVGGWIMRHVRDGFGSPRPSRTAIEIAVPVPIPDQTAGSVVWFVPNGDELTIRFDARPADGGLELNASGARQASAQITAHPGAESLLILPGELHVRNVARSSAYYRVTVPATVRRIRLVIGDEAARRIEVTPGLRAMIRLHDASP